ncbi:MAG: nuclear transport factor 2 family protein [Pseudomonadota bacterium]
MRGLLIVCGALALASLAQAKQPDAGLLADRVAIEDTMHRYIWSVDSLDADGYVSVFTEDAEIEQPNSVEKGLDSIRKVVTGMVERQAANRAAGKPPGALYHVVSNERISFQSATEATYFSYWQTMRKNDDGRYVTGGFGRSEDHLVKQKDGSWLIKHRKLTVFSD